VPVDLGLEPAEPPTQLFHGTPTRNVAAILRDGLHRGARHHVHLSPDRATAAQVGARRGAYTVLVVDAAGMHRDGLTFYRSANGVWLTDTVPPRYLTG
jgi:putative RNA 2'-phosphotransferase